jgi:hypothetical protein
MQEPPQAPSPNRGPNSWKRYKPFVILAGTVALLVGGCVAKNKVFGGDDDATRTIGGDVPTVSTTVPRTLSTTPGGPSTTVGNGAEAPAAGNGGLDIRADAAIEPYKAATLAKADAVIKAYSLNEVATEAGNKNLVPYLVAISQGEGEMITTRSLLNGEDLGSVNNCDKKPHAAEPKANALEAANKLKEVAKNYNLSFDNPADAPKILFAYNQKHNPNKVDLNAVNDSPYVFNGAVVNGVDKTSTMPFTALDVYCGPNGPQRLPEKVRTANPNHPGAYVVYMWTKEKLG